MQVKAARPTYEYDPRYGVKTGPWTTDMFVEAAYKSMAAKKWATRGFYAARATAS